jgi:ribA/ribD-fused uncharacterized protein
MRTVINSFEGDDRYLSNFAPSRVYLDKMWFDSVEEAYQAAKTLDLNARKLFQGVGPSRAKKAGKALALRPDWNDVKLGIMEDLLRQKFSDPDLKAKLLATKDAELIEGNWWGDTFWGVCRGTGQNHLGKLLMKIRSELCDQ